MARDRKRHVNKRAGADAPDADAASTPPVHVLATPAPVGLVARQNVTTEPTRLGVPNAGQQTERDLRVQGDRERQEEPRMGKRHIFFSQAAVTRAVKGAVAAGLEPSRVEIAPDGRIILTLMKLRPAAESDAAVENWFAQS